jgi:hypothetical protein
MRFITIFAKTSSNNFSGVMHVTNVDFIATPPQPTAQSFYGPYSSRSVMHVYTIKRAFCFEVHGTYSNNLTHNHCTRYIMDLSNISEDMAAKIQAILPALGAGGGLSSDDVPILDLSVAENELLRDELLELTKKALNDHLQLKVSP